MGFWFMQIGCGRITLVHCFCKEDINFEIQLLVSLENRWQFPGTWLDRSIMLELPM
jgi:hypothetical protein